MDDPALASSADYADALLIARRAKNLMVLILLVILLLQLGLFFAARYKIAVNDTSVDLDALKYFVGVMDFLGLVLPIVLGITLLIIVLVLLLGRLLGVAPVVSALLGCAVLAVLLFPWQAFLMNQAFNSDQFRIPGVLYTWSELVLRARSHPDRPTLMLLFWGRFVGWPVAALALLLRIQFSSGKGLRAALRNAARVDAAALSHTPPIT